MSFNPIAGILKRRLLIVFLAIALLVAGVVWAMVRVYVNDERGRTEVLGAQGKHIAEGARLRRATGLDHDDVVGLERVKELLLRVVAATV